MRYATVAFFCHGVIGQQTAVRLIFLFFVWERFSVKRDLFWSNCKFLFDNKF